MQGWLRGIAHISHHRHHQKWENFFKPVPFGNVQTFVAILKGWRSLSEKCLNNKKENPTYNIVAAASVDETLATFGADLPEMFQLWTFIGLISFRRGIVFSAQPRKIIPQIYSKSNWLKLVWFPNPLPAASGLGNQTSVYQLQKTRIWTFAGL